MHQPLLKLLKVVSFLPYKSWYATFDYNLNNISIALFVKVLHTNLELSSKHLEVLKELKKKAFRKYFTFYHSVHIQL